MMKIVIWIVGVAILLTAINYPKWKESKNPSKVAAAETLEQVNPVIAYQKAAVGEVEKMQVKMMELNAEQQKKAFDAQKVKVYVRAKDTKTCMKELKIDVINNEVAECNKDHYVEVRNDELEAYKKEHGL